MNGYLRLKVRELLEEHDTNLHQAMLAGGFSYPTMHRYMSRPERSESLHTPSIVALLVGALGMSPAAVEASPLGRFFEVVTDGEHEPLNPLEFYSWLMDQNLDQLRSIGDDAVNHLAESLANRLEFLIGRANGDLEPADVRRYALRATLDRALFWIRWAPDELRQDEALAGNAAAIIERLSVLLHEDDTVPSERSTTGTDPENVVD